MFCDVNNPEISLSDWERLRKEFPRHLIAEVIDRDAAWLPDWFMPLARGVAIASDKLLHQAGYHNEKQCPDGWHETSPDYFLYRLAPESYLLVRESDETNLWSIERLNSRRQYDVDDVLVFGFGWTPIFTRSYQSAMRLAMHCHVDWPPGGLSWIKGMPTDPKPAIELARHRRVRETAPSPG
jgi:hypothetical protein